MEQEEVFGQFEAERDEAIEWLRGEAASLRTGRVTPGLIERVPVEHYGARTPLHGLASINNSDARTIVIQPWDRGAVASIEKAITEANVGASPTLDGEVIRLVFPSMTDEMREQQLKKLHGLAEEARVRFRQARDEALKVLKQGKSSGELTEDDFYDGKERLDTLIGGANDLVEEIAHTKEEDIKAV